MKGYEFTYRPGAFFGTFIQVSAPRTPGKFGEAPREESIAEMLSTEHAIIERLMSVFEAMIGRACMDSNVDLMPLNHAAIMIKELGPDHHMKFEEDHVFPKFRNAGRLSDLVGVLKQQHDRGASILNSIIDMTRTGRIEDERSLNQLSNLCMSFVVMYRLHAAREETELFPALYDACSNDEMRDLADRMRDYQQKILGDKGLHRLIDKLSEIESVAGTSDLSRFTPPPG